MAHVDRPYIWWFAVNAKCVHSVLMRIPVPGAEFRRRTGGRAVHANGPGEEARQGPSGGDTLRQPRGAPRENHRPPQAGNSTI